jgi:hypothetical protein
MQKVQAETGSVPKWSADRHELLLRCLEQNPLPESNALIGRVYPGHLPIIEQKLNTRLPDEHHRLVVVRRDPRDALISLYYSLAVSHDPVRIEGDQEIFRNTRQNLQRQDIRDGLKSMLESDSTSITSQEFLECTELLLDNPDVCDLPYEKLLNSPRQWLEEFVQYANAGRYIDDQWMETMLENLQPPEIEDPSVHKRRMRPGNWVDVFDNELRDIVDQRIGQRMKQFGYVW